MINKNSLKDIRLFFYTLNLLIISSASYSQTTIVAWDFEDGDNIADSSVPANSSKTITTEGRTGENYVDTGIGTGANGLAIEQTSWNDGLGTKYWVIEFDATGYENLTLSSNQSSDRKGPGDFMAEYSTDGSTWITITGGLVEITVEDDWTVGVLSNISLPSSLDNNSSIYIRWVMTTNSDVAGNTVNPSGKSRIDEIIIQGSED